VVAPISGLADDLGAPPVARAPSRSGFVRRVEHQPQYRDTGRFPLVFDSLRSDEIVVVCDWLAECCQRGEQMAATLARVEVVGARARRHHADAPPVLLAAARMYLAAGDVARADEMATIAWRIDPTDPATLDLSAHIQDQSSDSDVLEVSEMELLPELAADELSEDEDVPTVMRARPLLLSKTISSGTEEHTLVLPAAVTFGQMSAPELDLAQHHHGPERASSLERVSRMAGTSPQTLLGLAVLATVVIGFLLTLL